MQRPRQRLQSPHSYVGLPPIYPPRSKMARRRHRRLKRSSSWSARVFIETRLTRGGACALSLEPRRPGARRPDSPWSPRRRCAAHKNHVRDPVPSPRPSPLRAALRLRGRAGHAGAAGRRRGRRRRTNHAPSGAWTGSRPHPKQEAAPALPHATKGTGPVASEARPNPRPTARASTAMWREQRGFAPPANSPSSSKNGAPRPRRRHADEARTPGPRRCGAWTGSR